uniref:Uncharacterized protein n=1 Tax=Arundo donax TaxID=35708 RepID=A0A0A9H109_ARUDO
MPRKLAKNRDSPVSIENHLPLGRDSPVSGKNVRDPYQTRPLESGAMT